jgi:hypothetical protein
MERIKSVVTVINISILIAGMIIGGSVAYMAVRASYQDYYLVQPTDIGGFIVKEGKIYNLTRLRDSTYKP